MQVEQSSIYTHHFTTTTLFNKSAAEVLSVVKPATSERLITAFVSTSERRQKLVHMFPLNTSSVFVDGLEFVIGANDKFVVASQSSVSNTGHRIDVMSCEVPGYPRTPFLPIKSVNLPDTGMNTKITTIRTTKTLDLYEFVNTVINTHK